MKRTNKILLAVLCVVLLATVSVLGTLAYLTDRETAVNTFTVGNIDITLDEEIVDEDGEPTDEGRTEDGNEYHLVPGQTYMKDPTVTVEAGSEESYIRMIVTLNCYSQLQEIFGAQFLPQDFVNGWDNSVWVTTGVISVDEDANTASYEFRYFETVDASESQTDIVLEALFESFTLPGYVTNAQLATLADFEITVEGHAIQTANIEDENAAWEAFSVQYNG